jgi:hypothetical protein
MKLILVLSLLCGCCQLGHAVNGPNTEDFASQMYQEASKKVAAFFKTGGTPGVLDSAHPSLRTEAAVIQDGAIAHFDYFKDNRCTQRNFIVDMQINHCSNFLGHKKPLILSKTGQTWTFALVPYDISCQFLDGTPEVTIFTKNSCTDLGGGNYVKFDILGNPKKTIAGGGAAIVYYDNYNDCHTSKTANLVTKAQVMVTFPINVCASAFFGFVKAVSCDSQFVYFNQYSDAICTPETAVSSAVPVNPAELDCSAFDLFLLTTPFRLLCLPDDIGTM